MNPLSMGIDEFRAMRLELNYSQTELGGLFGVEYHTVSRWENGRCSIPGSAKTLLWLLYDQQTNKNDFAVRDYIRSIGLRDD